MAERFLLLDRVADVYEELTLAIAALATSAEAYGLVIVSTAAVQSEDDQQLLAKLVEYRDVKMRHLTIVQYGGRALSRVDEDGRASSGRDSASDGGNDILAYESDSLSVRDLQVWNVDTLLLFTDLGNFPTRLFILKSE